MALVPCWWPEISPNFRHQVAELGGLVPGSTNNKPTYANDYLWNLRQFSNTVIRKVVVIIHAIRANSIIHTNRSIPKAISKRG